MTEPHRYNHLFTHSSTYIHSVIHLLIHPHIHPSFSLTPHLSSQSLPFSPCGPRFPQVLSLARSAVACAASSSLPSPQDSIACDAYLDDFIHLATTPPPPPLAPKPRPVASSLASRQQLNRPTPTQAQAPAVPSPLPLPPPPAPSSDALPELSLSAIQAQVGPSPRDPFSSPFSPPSTPSGPESRFSLLLPVVLCCALGGRASVARAGPVLP